MKTVITILIMLTASCDIITSVSHDLYGSWQGSNGGFTFAETATAPWGSNLDYTVGGSGVMHIEYKTGCMLCGYYAIDSDTLILQIPFIGQKYILVRS